MTTAILIFIAIVFIGYCSYKNAGLTYRVNKLEKLNRNNCSKKAYYKNVVENKWYLEVTKGQKRLIVQEITRLKETHTQAEIAEKLKVSPPMVSRLYNIETLKIKKNLADKYIKALRKID